MSNYFKFFYLKKVDSTNMDIRKKSIQTKKNIALFSEIQSSGKGRLNNVWYSKDGDLTCSFLLREKFSINRVGQINILACVSLFQVLEYMYEDIKFKIKWPNDIYVNEKKIAGILIETKIKGTLLDYFIIGFGVNLVSSPKGLKYNTTSISDFSRKLNPKAIFLNLARYIEKNLKFLNKNKFSVLKNIWLDNAKDYGNQIKVKQNEKYFSGKFVNLNNYGSLILETNSKNKLILSYGEIM